MFVYVSNSFYHSGPDGIYPKDGLSVFDFNLTSGALKHVQTVGGLRTPWYLARHPQLPVLYLLEKWLNADGSPETPEQHQKGDCVTTFAINKRDGTLSLMGRHSTGGLAPMHLNIHPSGRFIVFTNPGGKKNPSPTHGHITVFRLGPDGVPGEMCASEVYKGRSPAWRAWRPKPHPHDVFGDPAWKRIFTCCMMTDRILMHHFDANTGALTPCEQPYVQISSGAGSRTMSFHPSGRFFYVLTEFDATVSVFSHDSETGLTTIVQTISIHPEGFEGKKNGGHILVGPTGQYLYCSNRSYQCITVLRIDQATGELRLVGHRKTLGDTPRDFAFDPSGRFLLVTNQKGNMVVSFHVDPVTGDLSPTGHSIETHAPNCVVFGPA